MSQKYKFQKCLIINYSDLPKGLKENVKNDFRFKNNTIMEVQSEFYTPGYEKISWAKFLTISELKKHYSKLVKQGSLETFKEFLNTYDLSFELWMIKQIENKRINLKGVGRILIDIN